MTNLTRSAGASPRRSANATGGALIQSGADLVELVERLYLRLFRVALGLVCGAAVLSVIYAVLQPRDWHGGATPALAAGCAGAALATFTLGSRAYLWLRRRWFGPGLPAALGGLMLMIDGPGGPLWFVALAGIGMTAVLASPGQTVLIAIAATGCYLLGTLVPGGNLLIDHDPGRLAAAGGLTLDGLLCVAVVEWLARFVLRLHQLERELSAPQLARIYVGNIGEQPTPPAPAPRAALALPRGPSLLTARQLEVVFLLRDGLHHNEIAACLSISPRQVDRLVAHARTRVGAKTTAALVALLVTGGLVPAKSQAS